MVKVATAAPLPPPAAAAAATPAVVAAASEATAVAAASDECPGGDSVLDKFPCNKFPPDEKKW